VFEAYLDEAAFQAHMATEHNRLFNERISPHIEGGASSVVLLATPFEV
jgi:quinol monooxygenase YgiN